MVSDQAMSTESPPRRDPPAAVDVFALASRWRSEEEWMSVAEAIDAEPEPSHLNTINSSGLFNVVSPDKLSVEYNWSHQHGHDVGAVQANCPAPTRRLVYYFEMTVINAGEKGQMSIGFTRQDFKMQRQPGWEANSCGYHGDDGYLYRGQGKGEPFGPTFTANDVVGAGINYASKELFFTKNAIVVGTVPKDIRGPLFPTIAVHSQNEKVKVNFGKEPFLFDLEGFIMAQKSRQQSAHGGMELQPNISHWIVHSYLLHYGYQETLNSFENPSENTHQVGSSMQNGFAREDAYALNHRSILRQLIKSGDVDSAIQRLREWYPQVLQDDVSPVCFLLHSQRFIEYIRVGDLENAIKYSRMHLAKFFAIEQFINMAQETAGLIAYDDPLQSPVGYLLGSSQREFVADAVNALVLSTNPSVLDPQGCLSSVLERLLKQLTQCSLEVRVQSGEQGQAFYLHKEIQSGRRGKCI